MEGTVGTKVNTIIAPKVWFEIALIGYHKD